MARLSVVLAVSIGGLGLFATVPAQAHFQLVSPTSWWTQATDGSPQKMAPCGNEGASGTAASGVVTKVQPGQTIPVQVMATIAHPGWYRISLKQGAASTQNATAFPDPPTLGGAGTAQQCTPAFIDNPVWSPTQPVLADKLGLPAGSTSTTTTQSGTKTFNVTVPSNATCTSAAPCTLQVLMFMTDHTSGSCNYHHCADIAVDSGSGSGGAGGAVAATGGTSGGGTGGAGAGGVSGAAGGHPGAGGATGAAGSPGAGGAIGAAGSSGSGGATASAAGGSGNPGTGGAVSGAGGSGAGTGTGSNDNNGGCAVAGRATSATAVGVGFVLAMAVLLRRRRSRG
jgi:hypothetical protein